MEDTDVPTLEWLKSELLDYALNLGLDVTSSMTKRQILDAIEGVA